MANLVVRWFDERTEGPCAICRAPLTQPAGAQLCLVPEMTPVCRGCGKKHASGLCLLLDIGRLAQQVGRVSRHSTLTLPIGSLLQLTHAAEEYYGVFDDRRKP